LGRRPSPGRSREAKSRTGRDHLRGIGPTERKTASHAFEQRRVSAGVARPAGTDNTLQSHSHFGSDGSKRKGRQVDARFHSFKIASIALDAAQNKKIKFCRRGHVAYEAKWPAHTSRKWRWFSSAPAPQSSSVGESKRR